MDRRNLLLFLSGINLILVQFIIIREFSIVLFCTELVILIAAVAYFLGYSVGYFVSDKISRNFIANFSIISFLSHLMMFFGIRYMVGCLFILNIPILSVPLLFFLGSFLASSLYTIFLPRFILESTTDSLPKYYSIELLGTTLGLLLILTVGRLNFFMLFFSYFVILLFIIYLLFKKKGILIPLTAILMLFYLCFPVLDRMSTEFFYNSFYDFENCKLIYSAYSPYQKIEIIEDRDNGRKLYLNGLEYFNSSGLEDFNFYLSELPARLKKKSSILIVGSGSMSSVFRVSPFASQITTVEIDEKVYQAGKKYFEKYNRWREIKNWDVVIDDAKHYLANTSKKFDLIIVDIPAPYYIQTALLFTKEFYSMVRSKLKEEGIVSIYLCSQFSAEKKEFVSTRIVSAINNVFDHFFIINSGLAGNGFLIAGDNLRFDKEKIEEIVELYIKGDNFEVIEKSEVAKIIKDIKPASFYNLDIVLDLNIRALRNSTEFLP